MANYRNISVNFWTDSKVDDDFTPEDKYFYLYLLTNPHTNICGCYEVSTKQMERETGYNCDTVKRLITRLQNVHNVIRYSEPTKEILILRWGRYNWSNSNNVIKAVLSVSKHIKNKQFAEYIINTVNNINNIYQRTEAETDTVTDTVSVTDDTIGYAYPMDTVSETETEKSADALPAHEKQKRFTPPTVDEVKAYCADTGKPIDAEAFVDFYSSKGWKVGSSPMKDWKAAVRTWRSRDEKNGIIYTPSSNAQNSSFDLNQIDEGIMRRYQ